MSNHYIVAPGKNFEICVEQNLYGHRKNVLRRWRPDDRVIYYVDGKFAAWGVVTSDPFVDHKTVWPDDIYPHRIRVRPEVVLPPEAWISVEGTVKQKIVSNLGKYWILHIRDVHPIPSDLAEFIEGLIEERSRGEMHDRPKADFEELQKEAKKRLEAQRAESKPKKEEPSEDKLFATPSEAQSHDRTQWYLIKLGRALGCEVWVAKSDRGKSYKGEVFSELCLAKLPNLGFDQDTLRIIENIDVLWLKGNGIRCAFEVEHTTSVYSGILRLADLVSAQPNIAIKLFIVAPKERKAKVVYELNRPVFRERLLELVKYISYDKLEETLAKIEDFQGYLQVGLVEKIAEPCILKGKLL